MIFFKLVSHIGCEVGLGAKYELDWLIGAKIESVTPDQQTNRPQDQQMPGENRAYSGIAWLVAVPELSNNTFLLLILTTDIL